MNYRGSHSKTYCCMNENLPLEVARKQFYIHKDYVPTYYYAYKFLKDYIAKVCMRNDKSRVIMASNDYAFRRRFELTDMSTNYNELETSSLNFPFANFWAQNSTIIPDDRFAAKTAALIYRGIEMGSTRVRAASVKLSIPATLYFDREDDARLCCEKLYFESYNEHYYTTKAYYAGNYFELPISLEVNDLSFNPNFKEADWLKKQRIYPITLNFVVRTYILYPPAQPDYDQNVLDDYSNYDSGFEYNYLTREVIMDFMGYEDILFSRVIVGQTWEDPAVQVDMLKAEADKTSIVIKWVVKTDSDTEELPITSIRITDLQDNSVVELDKSATYYVYSGLTENSTYSYLVDFMQGSDIGARHLCTAKTVASEKEDYPDDKLSIKEVTSQKSSSNKTAGDKKAKTKSTKAVNDSNTSDTGISTGMKIGKRSGT